MKIAILSPFPPYRGGIAQLSTRLYIELKKNNSVKAFNFITLYPNIIFPGKTQFLTNDDIHIDIESDRVLSSINPISYKKTANKINKYSPDILIVPYWMSFLAPVFGLVSRLLKKNIKIVALVHNAIPHEKRFFDKAFARFFFNKCDAFIVLSELVKQDLLKLKSDAKILLIEHPIYDQYKERIKKDDACRQLKIESTKKNILFFGLIREYKGLDLLIQAMELLDDSFQLIIAGECYGDKTKYENLIKASKLKSNIYFFEQYIPNDEVSLFFSSADLLVLPYRSATQSGVIAVAYQMEQPILSTNVGSMGETIRKAETGIVIDNLSPIAIAEGIKTFFAEGNSSKYLENIRKEKERLSWTSFGNKLQVYLDELIKK